MALPETIVVRRKDIMEHLGISKRRFYALIEQGLIRQNFMRMPTTRKKPSGHPLYLREDVLKIEQMLKG
jgi:hypothetical protein